jgi:hypothetical protein
MRVTERAQDVVLHAKQEAGRLGHDRVGTEHLLLGLLGDQQCLAAATLSELGIPLQTVRRRVEETVGRGQGQDVMGLYLPMTKPATMVLTLAAREAIRLEADRLGTEHLLLGLAGVDPEPLPPDRGPPPWEPPPSARLRRVIPLAQGYPLPLGDQLVLLSLEVWSDWFDLRYAVVYATPEPEEELPRRAVLGGCEVSDRAGTAYTSPTSSSPSYGMVRVHQRTFVPSPPPGTDLLELRFRVPTWSEEAQITTTVDLRQGRPTKQLGAT